jgi:hypothetical protein
MPSWSATDLAAAASREAMATTSPLVDRRRPGITLWTPMLAVDRIPHRMLLATLVTPL